MAKGEGSVAVAFRNVSRHFGAVKAVDDVSFEIKDGEFFAMLGPSGSGKTTCLRLIAGFEQPSGGTVSIHGQDVNGIPPYDRDVNTVFQDYALFPHMTVRENVAYGLMIRKVAKAERERRASEMLDMVALSGFGNRRPSQLSGGQRQRVALARALVNHPSVLLLDEPLGALDLKLREQMQVELKAIQRRVGITFIYVTHDQGEALSMSDRVAVFNQGGIEQMASPAELYEHPRTAFVAGFVGISNLVAGELAQRIAGSDRPVSVRPEKIHLEPASTPIPDDAQSTDGRVASVLYLGANTRYLIGLEGGGELTVLLQNRDAHFEPAQGEGVRLWWEPRHLMRFEA
jgi:putative spermidine/putrescine transport system ATP-binding protein